MPEKNVGELSQLLRPQKILVPILIGLGVASFLLYRNFSPGAFETVYWTWQSTYWLLLAFLMVVIRDLAYMIRLRVLTDNQLSWKQSFDVIMLWEFCSAIAPAILGGGFA